MLARFCQPALPCIPHPPEVTHNCVIALCGYKTVTVLWTVKWLLYCGCWWSVNCIVGRGEVWAVLLVGLYCGLWRSVNCIVQHKKECWWQPEKGRTQKAQIGEHNAQKYWQENVQHSTVIWRGGQTEKDFSFPLLLKGSVWLWLGVKGQTSVYWQTPSLH